MKIKRQKDFYSGLMFAIAGASFAIGAGNYNIGSAARMGPGYFPLLLGGILSLLGLVVAALSLRSSEEPNTIGSIAWKPLLLVIGANLVFGILLGGMPTIDLPAMGLIVAIYALVVVAAMAGTKFSLKSALVLATVLAIGSYLTFIVGLSLQFQVWPTFISG
ncbi:tripartite tricarboxylate transporter TctB family protein [Variovorax dokdonensis]|uniref:Tripartite tricarboxylate transporter TctB family protein n=1 Tax=Variovorax dokdonensis TaxID=344883 RepID=A0ABT7NC72_9BURK|nr:tripartite tricarboxylate transporter TctB family protein [Variovorax dokdonensis]MDM0045455.1 tripartite tricarboxylate transporter TctB family protein [Variovorax dokdonensis]